MAKELPDWLTAGATVHRVNIANAGHARSVSTVQVTRVLVHAVQTSDGEKWSRAAATVAADGGWATRPSGAVVADQLAVLYPVGHPKATDAAASIRRRNSAHGVAAAAHGVAAAAHGVAAAAHGVAAAAERLRAAVGTPGEADANTELAAACEALNAARELI